MSPNSSPPCPKCGEATTQRVSWLKATVGFVLVILGFVLFLATLGASFVISIFGVFMMVPAAHCKNCGWRESDDQ